MVSLFSFLINFTIIKMLPLVCDSKTMTILRVVTTSRSKEKQKIVSHAEGFLI